MIYRPLEGQTVLDEDAELGEGTETKFCLCKQNIVRSATLKCEYNGCERGHWCHVSCLDIFEEEAESDEE